MSGTKNVIRRKVRGGSKRRKQEEDRGGKRIREG
jgi:hypothetical protein